MNPRRRFSAAVFVHIVQPQESSGVFFSMAPINIADGLKVSQSGIYGRCSWASSTAQIFLVHRLGIISSLITLIT